MTHTSAGLDRPPDGDERGLAGRGLQVDEPRKRGADSRRRRPAAGRGAAAGRWRAVAAARRGGDAPVGRAHEMQRPLAAGQVHLREVGGREGRR